LNVLVFAYLGLLVWLWLRPARGPLIPKADEPEPPPEREHP
jgi:hypothetical protein